ncbi:MAG: mismatch repair protein [Pseudomonadota bacterium]|jgi:DNA mismatch repair protein MutH
MFTSAQLSSAITPPTTEAILLDRAHALAGVSIESVATQAGLRVPTRLHRHKGWIGQLLESVLGADAGNLSCPDFIQLGIELKTLPLSATGKPRESTYVCAINSHQLETPTALNWRLSSVYKKLARVLWMPIEADPSIPLGERKFLKPFLWIMSKEEEDVLQRDWEELMEALVLGYADALSAHQGSYLQIRPKAANARVKTAYLNSVGELTQIVPKGFYLRPSFTHLLYQTAARAFFDAKR